MNKKHTIRFFKLSSILVISAILLNFSPALGHSTEHLSKNQTRINFKDIKKTTQAFGSLFTLNPEHETTGPLFYGKIKNGRFEVGNNGEMTYKIGNKNKQYSITENFIGATTNPSGMETQIIPFSNLTGKTNSQKNLTRYKFISLGEIYSGITATLRQSQGNIEKLITVKPNADPTAIKLELRGHSSLSLNDLGELLIDWDNTDHSKTIKFSKPVAFQQIGSTRKEVEIGYKIIDENSYGFFIGRYDSSYDLIIDPILYSTFVGGENNEEFTAEMGSANNIMIIATDPADSLEYVYVTGYTETAGDFPASFLPEAVASERGIHDIFIVKMPLDLSEISAAALVGGDGQDIYSSVTADSAGNIYLSFQTTSTDIPTTASSYQQTIGGSNDAAIMKLPPSLDSITSATYLGGDKSDKPGNLEVKNGYVYITGTTANTGGGNTFPSAPTSGADEVYNHSAGTTGTEIFISRLNDQLSNTYYAGTFIQTDMNNPNITVHSTDATPDNDKIFITGATDAGLEIADPVNAYQPTFGGGTNDKFLARFNSKLTTLEASTFLGGANTSYGLGSIHIHNAGAGVYRIITANDTTNAYGFFDILRTDGNNRRYDYDDNPNNQVLNGCGDDDIYVANLNFNLTEAEVAVICGSEMDYYPRITADPAGNIYLAGSTSSPNLPVTNDAYQRNPQDYEDIFLFKFPNDLSSLTAGTYLGGIDSTEYYSAGLDMDAAGHLYVTGQTYSMDFPTTPDTLRPYKNSTDSDYFVTVITNDLNSPCAPMLYNDDTDGAGPISAVGEMCLGLRINPAPAYFENVPSSFNFPAKYATSIAQSSFNNTTVSSDDILTIRDLSGTGSFNVTIQASSLTNGYETINLTNLYLVTTTPGSANLNTLDPDLNGTTSAEQITYAEGSLGQNLIAPLKTTGDLAYPATYLTSGENFASGPVTIISAASVGHYLRASTALSFYLNIPSNTTPGTYSTIFTIDLIQN